VVFAVHHTHLRLYGSLLCAALFWFVAVSKCEAQETYAQYANHLVNAPPEGVQFSTSLEANIAAAVNDYRRSKGYGALKASTKFGFAARAQAVDLLQQGRVGHVSSKGYDFAARMRALRPGVMALPVMGENAARSTRRGLSDGEVAAYIVRQWIKSPSHRRAMISRDYLGVATGVARRGEDVYAVQIFVGPETRSNLSTVESEISPANEQGVY
jgi:uncharacterized protein YkwD